MAGAPVMAETTPDRESVYVQVGIELLDFRFDEFADDDSRLLRESGILPGIVLTAGESRGSIDVTARVSLHDGDVDYDGSDSSGAPFNTRTDERIADLSLQVGKRMASLAGGDIGPVAGLGWHHWQRDIRNKGPVLGLSETYRWWYVYAGGEWKRELTGGHWWSVDARLSRTLSADVDVDFEDGKDSKRLALGEKTGARLAVTWGAPVLQDFELVAQAFVEQFKLGRSADQVTTSGGVPVGTVFEPRSETRNLGLSVSLRRPF